MIDDIDLLKIAGRGEQHFARYVDRACAPLTSNDNDVNADSQTDGCATMIEYGVQRYKISDAAKASGISLNTLRSYYQRGEFRLVGSDEKKGRGNAALLTLEDVMAISSAARLIAVGVAAGKAFDAVWHFAYSGLCGRMSADAPFTMLVYWPNGESQVVASDGSLQFTDLFGPINQFGRMPPTVVLLNEVERRVFWALSVGEPDYTL